MRPTQPPQWILDEVLRLLNVRLAQGDDGPWKIQSISPAKSAQQQVFILRFEYSSESDRNNNNYNDKKSNEWADAMRVGKNTLVLRIWKGGSRWWNLNRNEDPLELARSEIMGYTVAHQALEDYRLLWNGEERTNHKENDDDDDAVGKGMVPKIPRVLHFHVEPMGEQKGNLASESLCWAVLEYVGADENDDLITATATKTTTTTTINTGNTNGTYSCVKVDRSYLEGMIKIRREFGFDEPHPRWGRVPVDEALEYARTILHQVLLPLHRYSSRLDEQDPRYNLPPCCQQQQRVSLQEEESPTTTTAAAKTFSSMVSIYRNAWKDVSIAIQRQNQQTPIAANMTNGQEGRDHRIEVCLERLDEGISFLERVVETETSDPPKRIPPLDPVLLHLDLQPQNLIFYRPFESLPSTTTASPGSLGLSPNQDTVATRKQPSVFSVLDWEDAAWGDPRFDLILLCRKVCANRDQANALWLEYAEGMAAAYAESSTATQKTLDQKHSSEPNALSKRQQEELPERTTNEFSNGLHLLGPIEPWLRLETVHSITTMLMQSMDLVNGGRNPWETKKDLWGKLEREFTRLKGYEILQS